MGPRVSGTNNLPDCSEYVPRGVRACARRRPRHRQRHRRSSTGIPRRRSFILGVNGLHAAPRMLTRARRDAYDLQGRGRPRQPTHRGRRDSDDHPARDRSDGAGQRRRRRARSTSRSGRAATWPSLRGIAKAVFEASAADPHALDHEFARYTHGLTPIAPSSARRVERFERQSGLGGRHPARGQGSARSDRTLISWCPVSPNTSTASTRFARSSMSFSRAAISVARARAHHRCADTAMSRATAPAVIDNDAPESVLSLIGRSLRHLLATRTRVDTVGTSRGDEHRRCRCSSGWRQLRQRGTRHGPLSGSGCAPVT